MSEDFRELTLVTRSAIMERIGQEVAKDDLSINELQVLAATYATIAPDRPDAKPSGRGVTFV